VHGRHGKVIATAGEAAVAPRLIVPSGLRRSPCSIGVGDGFSGGDEHLHRLIWVHPGSGQPTAQGSACGGQLVTRTGNFSSSGRDGDKAEDNVALIAAAWPERK
jgi:hypothetical protein